MGEPTCLICGQKNIVFVISWQTPPNSQSEVVLDFGISSTHNCKHLKKKLVLKVSHKNASISERCYLKYVGETWTSSDP